MSKSRSAHPIACLWLIASMAGCDTPAPTDPVSPSFAKADAPELPPAADFVASVTNPYFPLVPGTVFTYRADTEDGIETTIVTVTSMAKAILGISATVVNDQVFLAGELIEDTYDWYAQDRWGNVWYLGEASCEIVDDACVSTEGSWEAGIDGALAGIIMWSDPAARTGRNYRQEFYEDEAEDLGKVLQTGLAVDVPAGSFTNCIRTMDSTPLEPGSREHKFYCYGTGLVLEVSPSGGREANELISVTGP